MNIKSEKVMPWDDAFATGVSEIDEQHMILVYILNESAMRLHADRSRPALDQISQDLLGYALYHFETEEALMHEFGYAETLAEAAAQHLNEHHEFSAKVVAMRDRLRVGDLVMPDELINFLRDWLTSHILNTDRKFGAFVRAKRAR